MGDGVFLFGGHLCEADAGLFWNEDRVVAEASVDVPPGSVRSVYLSFEDVFLAVETERYFGNETGRAVGRALHLGEHLADIVIGRAVGAGIAGRHHAGTAVKGVDHKAGVVGETIVAVFLFHPAGLDEGVALAGVGGFGNIFGAADRSERQDLYCIA